MEWFGHIGHFLAAAVAAAALDRGNISDGWREGDEGGRRVNGPVHRSRPIRVFVHENAMRGSAAT